MSGKSYGEIQGALQAAVSATMKKDDYAWVVDFDDNTVIYSSHDGTFQADYSIDSKGNVTLGDPVAVRPVTTYTPVGDKKGAPTFESRAQPARPTPPATVSPLVRVRSEPLTYSEHSSNSFFHDLAWRAVDRDPAACDRLARHVQEMDVEMRAGMTTVTGAGGELVPPKWMIDRFASASRAGRPLADLIGPLPLPPGIDHIDIPRMTTGSSAGIQIDGAPASSQDMVTVDASSQVVTITGLMDVSQQLYDQTPNPGFDAVAYIDLNRAYNKALETQLLTGTGVNGQLLGLLNIPNITTIAGSTGTTVTTFWPFLAQAAAGVGNNRLLPPEIWLMAPRRWFFIAGALDSSNRPLTAPGSGGQRKSSDLPPEGGAFPVGPILGLPVYMDGAIPALAQSDAAVCCRPSDMFLFEGALRTMATVQPLSGTLQVRLSLHRYVAFVGNRYPSGIGAVTALPPPANF